MLDQTTTKQISTVKENKVFWTRSWHTQFFNKCFGSPKANAKDHILVTTLLLNSK